MKEFVFLNLGKRMVVRGLGAALVFMSVLSCVKQEEANSWKFAPGMPVVFSATAPGDTDPRTKTVYSGKTYNVGTAHYERIDWVDGDRLRIYSAACSSPAEKYADYAIDGDPNTSSDQKSSAAIKTVSGQGLAWGEGVHDFYAIYPSPEAGSASAKIKYTGGASATLHIPAVQTFSGEKTTGALTELFPDMNYAYMFAAQRVNPTANVSLAFRPLFTAFQITVGSDGADFMDLYSFSLTAAQEITGTYAVSMDAAAGTWALDAVTDGKNIINVDLGGPSNPVRVTNTEALTFTVFAVPQSTINKVVLHFETSKGPRSLELKYADDSWVSFSPGKKVVIEGLQIPGQLRFYTVEPIGNIVFRGHAEGASSFAVRSYSQGPGGTVRDEKWKIEYSTDYNPDTQAGTWHANTTDAGASWLTIPEATSYAGDEVTLNVTCAEQSDNNTEVSDKIEEVHQRVLSENVTSGSAGVPYDLSMYTVHDERRSLPVTANCYVVQAPGDYVFPIVYGNAIDGTKTDAGNLAGVGNVVNSEAYQPGGSHIPTDARYFLKRFFNADNQPIGTPFIENDLSISDVSKLDAIALWQDGSETSAIITAPLEIVEGPSSSPLKGKCHFIKFTIDKANIRQGNIVIALRDISAGTAASTAKIIWSWHIWVTDENLHGESVDMQSGSLSMMPFSLGWSDIQGSVETTEYKSRRCYIRISQVDASDQVLPDGASVIFQVYQKGDLNYTVLEGGTSLPSGGTALPYLGSNPFYQWGRKDPFLGRDYAAGEKNMKFIAASGYTIQGSHDYGVNYDDSISSAGDFNFSGAIQNPYIYYRSHGTPDAWFIGNTYNNTDIFIKGTGHLGPHNLWNAYSAGHGYDTEVRKTVYDPCPPGFSMPRSEAFTGFTNDGNHRTSSDQVNGFYDKIRGGYYFYKTKMSGTTKHPEGGTQFFCTTGRRRYNTGEFADNLNGGYWTSERDGGGNTDAFLLSFHTNSAGTEINVYPKYSFYYFASAWSVRPVEEDAW